jgi:hypothetical protein
MFHFHLTMSESIFHIDDFDVASNSETTMNTQTHLGTSSITSGSSANSSSILSRSARPLPLASISALSHVESTLSK